MGAPFWRGQSPHFPFFSIFWEVLKSQFVALIFFLETSTFTCMRARFSLKKTVLPAWELTRIRFGLTLGIILVTFWDTISRKLQFYLHGSSDLLGNSSFIRMGAPFYQFWRGPGLTFGIAEVQGSLLERFWLPFWTQSLQRFSFKRASRSYAKTGFFLCLEIAVLPAWQLILHLFRGN